MRRFRTEILLSLALVLLTAGAYASVLRNGFVNYDDNDYVVENFSVNSGLSGPNLRWAFTATHAANWHPLTWLSLQLDATLVDRCFPTVLFARWCHAPNLVLHVA